MQTNHLPFKIIEALLVNFKCINTNDINDYLGIKRVQSQRYFSLYREKHDPAVYYDRKVKKHIATDKLKLHYIDKQDAAKILRSAKFLFVDLNK